jgi:hypothetical protein
MRRADHPGQAEILDQRRAGRVSRRMQVQHGPAPVEFGEDRLEPGIGQGLVQDGRVHDHSSHAQLVQRPSHLGDRLADVRQERGGERAEPKIFNVGLLRSSRASQVPRKQMSAKGDPSHARLGARPGRKARLVRLEKINDPERAGFSPTSARYAPAGWNRCPMRKPTAAAPSPMAVTSAAMRGSHTNGRTGIRPYRGSTRGSPKWGKTLLSENQVMALIWSPRRVRTIMP